MITQLIRIENVYGQHSSKPKIELKVDLKKVIDTIRIFLIIVLDDNIF